MNEIFQIFGFLNSPLGLILLGAAAAAIVLVWEWRIALAALMLIQLGVAAVTVQLHGIPAEWAGIMTAVMGLAVLTLALSAQDMRGASSRYQSGPWLLRATILTLFLLLWRLVLVDLQLPQVAAPLMQLFSWLGVCVLLILALGENPLFTAVALLLWLVPAQAVIAILVGIPALLALVGIIELIVALACSYLLLVEQISATSSPSVPTDITFPDGTKRRERSQYQPAPVPGFIDWVRERWRQREQWTRPAAQTQDDSAWATPSRPNPVDPEPIDSVAEQSDTLLSPDATQSSPAPLSDAYTADAFDAEPLPDRAEDSSPRGQQ